MSRPKRLQRLLGVQKIIWLPGIAGRDITDGHTDFYARFAAPGVVVAGLDNDPDSFDFDVTRSAADLTGSLEAYPYRVPRKLEVKLDKVMPLRVGTQLASGLANLPGDEASFSTTSIRQLRPRSGRRCQLTVP